MMKLFNPNIISFAVGLVLMTIGLYGIYRPLAAVVAGTIFMLIGALPFRRGSNE